MPAKRHALAERRRILGHSQESLARMLGVEPSTVGRWERGTSCPQPWSRPALAGALDITVLELDALLTPSGVSGVTGVLDRPGGYADDPVLAPSWDHRGTVEAAVALRGGGAVQRRHFLFLTGAAVTAPAHQWLVHDPGPLHSGLAGQRISTALTDRLPAMISELRTLDDRAGGATVLTLAQHDVDWLTDLLQHASYTEPTGRALHTALAELAQLTGWAAYDHGHHALAQRYNIAALRAAHTAGDRMLGAHVLGSMAKQAAHQHRPAEAITLAETALSAARDRATPRQLAQLHLRHAYALAQRGDAAGSATAIAATRDQLSGFDAAAEPPWLYWVDPAWVTVEAGNCLLVSGQSDRAATMLADGIALFGESYVRDRQIYSLHLAEALARPGTQQDLVAAAGQGMNALDLDVSSTVCATLVQDLRHDLTPHANVPAVRDFLDRARDVAFT